MPWLSLSVVIMTPVVCASALRMGWFWSFVLSMIQTVFATASSLRYVAPEHLYQVRRNRAHGGKGGGGPTTVPAWGYLTRPSSAVALQAVFVMVLCVVLATLGNFTRENAERGFWASLYHTARAQFLQEAAERNQREMELKREAADARSKAAQSVMRYVCHELRNPLHGIMVRAPQRSAPRSTRGGGETDAPPVVLVRAGPAGGRAR